MNRIPKGASPLRNLQGQLVGYELNGKKHMFSERERPITPKISSQRKEGQRAILNDKPVVWQGGEWVPIKTRNFSTEYGTKSNTPTEGDKSTWKRTETVKPVSKTEPETPAPDTRLNPAPAPAKEIVPAPSRRSLKIKEARTKYKDSPFKQWAHANQALAKALKPGQVGYEQVQEYFREQTKTKMGRGANDLSGYAGSTSPIA